MVHTGCFPQGEIRKKNSGETEHLLHSQRAFSLFSLVLISFSGYCIFCPTHAIAGVLKSGEIILGSNPGNHF